jgi:ribosomal peptide maturation radical SAM protein 1
MTANPISSTSAAGPAPATNGGPHGSPRPLRIALVNMPFASAARPSIQCGLLKAILEREGHTVDVHYLNLELAAELGPALYLHFADLSPWRDQLLGEWLFSVAAFGYRPNEKEYFEACHGARDTCNRYNLSPEDLCRLRNESIPALVERWATGIDWAAYAAVGFSCTFEQTVAAFALGRRIKELHPQVVTIYGGANFESEMGVEHTRAFPWIDYAVVGEGDVALPALVGRIAAGEPALDVPGVVGRAADGQVVSNGTAAMVRDMDSLPDPEYSEYFQALFRLGRARVLAEAIPIITFEGSRGCWWGAKSHCTFCGLNNTTMAFRSKSPERVLAELRRQSAKYSIPNFLVVDNIMDMRYLEGVCEPLGEQRYDYTFFFEVKANLSREQLRTLAGAGVRAIQPGIESLSSRVLKLMRKGSTRLINVRLLKWASYYGMSVTWNMLCGFPGESSEDYEEQKRLMPLLYHLPPPDGCGPVWVERFSPYFTDKSFPVENIRPKRAYSLIWPAETVALEKIAYFFDAEMGGTISQDEFRALNAAVGTWRQQWSNGHRPTLSYTRAPDWLQVIDLRVPERPQIHALHDERAAVYELCSESWRTPADLQRACEKSTPAFKVSDDDMRKVLGELCEMGLMLEEDQRFLSLAQPVNPNW